MFKGEPMKSLLLAVPACLSLACGGDMRHVFVGMYNLSTNVTYSANGKSFVRAAQDTQEILPGPQANMLVFGGSCGITGEAVSETAFTIDTPVTCPPAISDGCQTTGTYTQGSGTLNGKSITFTLGGTFVLTCPGQSTTQGSMSAIANGTKIR